MNKRMISTIVAGATLAVATLAVSTTTATAASASPCPSGVWSSSSVGVPAGAHAGMNGIAVFRRAHNDNFSVVMIANAPSHPVLYTGLIQSDGPLSFRSIRTERGDVIRKIASNKIVFAMTNAGHLDGLTVSAPCSSMVRMTFDRGLHRVATANIVVGSTSAHPATNPFTLVKR